MLKDKLKRFFSSEKLANIQRPIRKRTGYLIVIALLGLLLLILGKSFTNSQEEPVTNHDFDQSADEPVAKETSSEEGFLVSTVEELEENYAKELEDLLNKIKGVSEVEVMINLDSTNIKVYEQNLIVGQQTTDESDRNGGIRKVEDSTEETQIVLVRQGDRDVPLLVQTKKPNVRGVFIVANGVDHATVKMWVLEAVSRVLDVPPHRVSVMPKN